MVRDVDIGIANEEDCQAALGIEAEPTSTRAKLEARVPAAAEKVSRRLSEPEDAGDHAARIESASHTAGRHACMTAAEFMLSRHYEINPHRGSRRGRDSFAAA